MEVQRHFPGLKIEGGPYTPPKWAQYGVKAARAAQGGVGIFFVFGEQILQKLGQEPFSFMAETHTNLAVHLGALYGFNVIADMFKSINAFEVVYNGEVLHSKLSSGGFPAEGDVSRKLREVLAKQAPTVLGGA